MRKIIENLPKNRHISTEIPLYRLQNFSQDSSWTIFENVFLEDVLNILEKNLKVFQKKLKLFFLCLNLLKISKKKKKRFICMDNALCILKNFSQKSFHIIFEYVPLKDVYKKRKKYCRTFFFFWKFLFFSAENYRRSPKNWLYQHGETSLYSTQFQPGKTINNFWKCSFVALNILENILEMLQRKKYWFTAFSRLPLKPLPFSSTNPPFQNNSFYLNTSISLGAN